MHTYRCRGEHTFANSEGLALQGRVALHLYGGVEHVTVDVNDGLRQIACGLDFHELLVSYI